jgi:hypothetical protein
MSDDKYAEDKNIKHKYRKLERDQEKGEIEPTRKCK